MLAKDVFTPARVKQMRDEICEQGFVADNFLVEKPDCPVFGVNLACLYPFPTEVHDVYQKLATQFAELDPGVYVYPIWETHVTIATFINFTQHQDPSPERDAELSAFMQQIIANLEGCFDDLAPFDLWIEQPLISRKAAFLPLSDLTDAVTHIRGRLAERLNRNPILRKQLDHLGLNIPAIVHSTIMRFNTVPSNDSHFASKFDEIAKSFPRVPMRVNEIYITTETKPYMRAGEIIHRFPMRS
jgi:hypothetical protein